jgi:N-acetylglutamate synthase-like GNAT family acetyltransferase
MSQLLPISIRKAGPADRGAVESLLTRTGLPIDGVADHLDHFAVAVDGDTVVGSAGLEVYGRHGLLRSVAVLPERQHGGLGRRLIETALETARRERLASVTLLTTTATDYFPRFGFRRIEQSAAPEAVKASTQFRGACPSTAAAMLLEFHQEH